jgi:hypothetical protein
VETELGGQVGRAVLGAVETDGESVGSVVDRKGENGILSSNTPAIALAARSFNSISSASVNLT